MAGDLWQKGPLGEEIERHLGRRAEGLGWSRAMQNWDATQVEIRHNASFASTLSVSQLNSLRLILDWWDGDCEEPSVLFQSRNALYLHAKSGESDQRVPDGLDLDISLYHKALFDLFLYEFFFYGQSTAAPIQLRRHKASQLAVCQRLALQIPLIRYRLEMNQANELLPTFRNPVEKVRSTPALHRPLGAVIEACPWLSDDQKHGMPYYLWDISGQRTVRVDDLAQSPLYCVISHTWGRWRLDNPVEIPGVPWLVPRNTRFNVEDLPQMFQAQRNQFIPATYIWFDLLCIPQDGSDLADVEIARQAAIFGSAEKAMVWLNDIQDWSTSQAGLQCLALNYLTNSSPGMYDTEPAMLSIKQNAASSTGLFREFTRSDTDPSVWHGIDPSGWFTSLWTLQESFLRPGMTFHNARWDVLKLNNDLAAQPVTLDSILALVHFNITHNDPENAADQPRACNEITALIHNARFDSLLEYSPLTALTLASRRECSAGRAEAIMSVFGATDWFKQSDKADREKNLVFDSYPIQFIREVQSTIGTNFFCSWHADCCFWDVFSDDGPDGRSVRIAGTLLPFDNLRRGSKVFAIVSSTTVQDHPSTKNWRLLDDGRVSILEAGIVATTEDEKNARPVFATVTGPSKSALGELDIANDANLKEWLRNVFPGVPKRAVCLQYSTDGWSRGVILMRLFDDENPPRTFAKLGDYYTAKGSDLTDTKTLRVDWDVL